jgi:nitrite reductase/ring-hydroxylating ferredoxin subunit
MSDAGSRAMADEDRTAGAAEPKSGLASGFGRGFLYDLWYFAALGSALKPGRLQRYEMLGQPILLGRNRAGQVFALRDICPHRAAPLSAGKLIAEPGGVESVQCPYHGWRFAATDGACLSVPSLLADQDVNVERIKVRAYPVKESQGLVFIYMAADTRSAPPPIEPPPTFEGMVGGGPKLVDKMSFDTHLDHAVVGPMSTSSGGGDRPRSSTTRPNGSSPANWASPWSAMRRRRTAAPIGSSAARPRRRSAFACRRCAGSMSRWDRNRCSP